MSRAELKNEILQIRDSGLTNMLDTSMVQKLAFRSRYYSLVNFIEEKRGHYVQFILTGNENFLGQDEEEQA